MLIIIILILIAIIYLLYNHIQNKKQTQNKTKTTIDIDKLEIIKRTEAYQDLINKLINEKKTFFTPHEIEIMKNKFQFYNTENGINNITDDILKTYYNNNNNNNLQNIDNNISITGNIYTNPTFNDILNNIPHEKTCKNVKVLQNKNYLNNYYYDMYGNKIKASLKDYVNDYDIRIDNNNNEGQKVEIIKGSNNFIIPNQYHIYKYATNAYNIDWNRIIHPLTVF